MKWYGFVTLIIIIIIAGFGFGWAMLSVESDKINFSECENLYEAGDCLLYQCKMNYSTTISVSWTMYELYHHCLIEDAKCVDSVVGGSE